MIVTLLLQLLVMRMTRQQRGICQYRYLTCIFYFVLLGQCLASFLLIVAEVTRDLPTSTVPHPRSSCIAFLLFFFFVRTQVGRRAEVDMARPKPHSHRPNEVTSSIRLICADWLTSAICQQSSQLGVGPG